MRILILGAGAIGGFFGARLLQAGTDVSFLVRPARAALLREHGLCVHGRTFEFSQRVNTLCAVEHAFDLVLLSCKAGDLDGAIDVITPAVGARTRVLPLLNGLRHLDRLDAAFGAQRVLGGLAHISVTLEDDGAIRQFGTLERLGFGSRDAGMPVPAPIRAALLAISSQVVEQPDILAAMWDKLAFIATLAGITCLMRAAVGSIVASDGGAALIERLYAECCAIAARSGHPVATAAREAARVTLTTPDSPLKASMLRDLERGATTEAEHILGDLHHRANGFGLDVPLLTAALCHLRVYEATRGSVR
ncbi:2-dehydropantoate 2-reductase [Dokdonella sp.]|uniref:2-dehydropantoate 2-reductase n=1 Tax=Dokdonella sp. TaxID=2291710 RepID=UPI0025C6DB07|nr:2-dehydropantoate 2-reductase [Dokdonella sp.]MBX3688136.1 2-dehydropantoate 2-reductase [Dokdonella sp.]